LFYFLRFIFNINISKNSKTFKIINLNLKIYKKIKIVEKHSKTTVLNFPGKKKNHGCSPTCQTLMVGRADGTLVISALKGKKTLTLVLFHLYIKKQRPRIVLKNSWLWSQLTHAFVFRINLIPLFSLFFNQ